MGLARRVPGRSRIAYVLALIMLLGTILTFATPVQATHPPTSCLDLEPELANLPIGTAHTITATLRVRGTTQCTGEPHNPSGIPQDVPVSFEVESGPTYNVVEGNPTGTKTPANDNTADFSCTIRMGTNSCRVSFTASTTGTNAVRGWTSGTGDSADQTEGRDETSVAGGTREPDNTDVVEVSWEDPNAPLNCDPETDLNPAGTNHVVTCSARTSTGAPAAGIRIDAELVGANDPDDQDTDTNTAEGDTRTSPDFSCTTDASGQCSFTHGPGGNANADARAVNDARFRNRSSEAGVSTYVAWIDADNNDGTVEADATEGPNETTQAGSVPESDDTDVVQKTWGAARVDCFPETDTNPTGLQHSINCRATDVARDPGPPAAADPVASTAIDIEATGANDPDASNTPATPDFSCITREDGTCTFTHGEGGIGNTDSAGTTTYRAWVDLDNDDDTQELDPDETQVEENAVGEPDNTDTVSKFWVASRLDCAPESDTNPAETSHAVTCTARDEAGAIVPLLNIDAEATGANDPDTGDTPRTPDFTCTTSPTGSCTFTHGPGGRGTTVALGKTTYRAWVDADNDDATAETDPTESRDEGPPAPTGTPTPTPTATGSPSPTPTSGGTASPSPTGSPSPEPTAPPGGNTLEPDSTDVVEKNWTAVPDRITMQPESDQGVVGSCNTFTITAVGPGPTPSPVAGVVVDFEQRHESSGNATANDEPDVSFCTPNQSDGPNPSGVDEGRGDLAESPTDDPGTAGGEADRATDENGQITIGIRVAPTSGSSGAGGVVIVAFYENEDNDDPDAGDAQDSSRKTWVPPRGRNIDCDPDEARNPLGTTHTVTCTVRDEDGGAARGESVTFTEDGPGRFTSDTQKDTDANGQVTATVTSEETGRQTITATLTADLQSEPDTDACDRRADDPTGAPEGNCQDSVFKDWASGRVVESGPCQGFAPGSRNDTDGDGDDDIIVGTGRGDALLGTTENDVICGLGGRDRIDGSSGNDDVVGNAGRDVVRAGGGKDQVNGGGGADVIRGQGGNDVLAGASGTDRLLGNAGEDTLRGGPGADTLRGGADQDLLRGSGGNDNLSGGGGPDTLDGGGGTDTCTGGRGRDRLRTCE